MKKIVTFSLIFSLFLSVNVNGQDVAEHDTLTNSIDSSAVIEDTAHVINLEKENVENKTKAAVSKGGEKETKEKGIDEKIDEAFQPVSDFFSKVVFFKIFGIPFVLILLVFSALFFTL